ncbi:hypothetical protein NOV72_05408 [Caballeronia novacaledonica]|uniref:Uncharacterized protein n=1 Tax=Caballeronia novacaledonica TaxID=1544861 RepID=A0A2U3IDC4_9BURK|nr:hypothetical protein [Caballeronia novacaledonica]SPB18209.1 hypothetical protein NOV72_05408 [Caballeronia novacaledonica]
MDIFYYWQKLEQDLKSGRVGYFAFNSTKILELKARLPNRVWVFKTPRGMKGAVQLVGSLLVSDEPNVAVNADHQKVIYYDPFSSKSVMFVNSGTPERIQEVSGLLQYSFHTAFKSNFSGDAGLQPLESNVVRALEAMSAHWAKVQLLERVKDAKRVQPINPFAFEKHVANDELK